MAHIKLILIGGTSHTGKSTLARQLAEELGWNYLSTDQLARHPGRPWKVGDNPLPDDVIEHYTTLSVADLEASVLEHYRSNVWPIIDAIVTSRLNNPFDRGLVFEGSAILPDLCVQTTDPRVAAFWLIAPEELIAERIRQSSGYDTATAEERHLIDAFLDRSVAFNRTIQEAAARNNQQTLDVLSEEAIEAIRSSL